jgi:hypothetical protein
MSVVLGYDEGPGAVRALRVAIEVSAAFGEPLVLVFGAAAPGSPSRGVRRSPRGRPRADASRSVTRSGWPTRAGVRATVEVVDQKPAEALLKAASRHARGSSWSAAGAKASCAEHRRARRPTNCRTCPVPRCCAYPPSRGPVRPRRPAGRTIRKWGGAMW